MIAYDTIIYGGGLYAGGVGGFDLIIKNFDKISHKNLILFTCGQGDPNSSVNTERVKSSLKKVFSPSMEEKLKAFYLRGAIDYSKLSITDKSMMAIINKMMLKKDLDTLSLEDKEMIAAYGQTVDFTDRTTIEPIIEYIHSLE